MRARRSDWAGRSAKLVAAGISSVRQSEPFDNEEISAFEIGSKTDWPDANLQLNGSALYYDRRGKLVSSNLAAD